MSATHADFAPENTLSRAAGLVPGLLLLAAIGYAGKFIEQSISAYARANHFAFPNIEYVLWAILIGLVVRNTVGVPRVCQPGVATYEFWLKLGIVLLGVRFVLGDVLRLGGVSLIAVALELAMSIVLMTWLGKRFGLSPKLVSLLAIGSSICGVSAIIAARGAIRAKDEDVSYAIASILALGAISLVAFPLIGHAVGLTDHSYGLWAGLAVDNTAEATAAGGLWSEAAQRIAVLAKTTRNATIGFVVLGYAIYWARQGEADAIGDRGRYLWQKFPRFVLGFLAVSLLATLGAFTKDQSADLANLSKWAFLLTFAGVGLQTDIGAMRRQGAKPFIVGALGGAGIAALTLGLVLLAQPLAAHVRRMRHLPVFLDISGRRALVLGSGEVAHRKADALRRAGALVEFADEFRPENLAGCAVAIGADAPLAELVALSEAAQAAGIPVNVVDRPELCNFITPSVIDRDPLLVAVSSGGAAPVLARLVRARIEAMLPPAWGALARFADGFKAECRARLPDVVQRRRVLERTLGGRVADLVLSGNETAARVEMEREIARGEAGGAGPGICYLVGAGPGAADLLTIRAQRILGEADVIVHDRLVTDEVLDMARRDAERIYVGKQRANHCLKQDEINALLVKLARQGKRVVRLKGGDPFVFGRGGEEAEALADAGIAFEVVPGVTAALACAAGAGIPLTHRDAARTLTLATGHTKDGRLDLDFAALAAVGGTLAVYMGLVTLPQLADGLRAAGLPGDTPAALVERGGTASQRTLFGTLPALVREAPGWAQGGPVLVLVGPAVGRAIRGGVAAAETSLETVHGTPG